MLLVRRRFNLEGEPPEWWAWGGNRAQDLLARLLRQACGMTKRDVAGVLGLSAGATCVRNCDGPFYDGEGDPVEELEEIVGYRLR